MTKRWLKGARKVIEVCACVRKGERTLIVTDIDTDPMVSMSLLEACRDAGSEALIAMIGRRRSANEAPPPRVVDLMLRSDVIICPTHLTMFYTDAKRRACRRGARFLSMAEATLDVLSHGAIEADFRKQKPLVHKVAKKLTEAKEICLCSAAGASVTASLVGRRAVAITGICEKPGESTGVPDIEAYVAPMEDSVEGVAIVDDSISGLGLVRTPVKLEIHNGIARKITGGAEARKLRNILSNQNDPTVYQIAEIGIGLNPKARLRGSIIEDESVLGTTHLALGDNSKFGGRNLAPVHIDLVLRKSSIHVDRERVPSKLGRFANS